MNNLTFAQKRFLTVFAFSVRMFFMGAEEAVIFPSIWPYLQMFHVDYWYLGLVLSAYYTVGIASAILVGSLSDRNTNLRFSAFVWNLAEVVGNTIYSLHYHMSLPLLGRMVSGFGEGYTSAMYGELARITNEDERTRYFAIIKANYIIGMVVGPALNLFLKEFDFYIGSWHIDFRTSPGFFMAVMWIMVTGIMIVFVYDLSEMRKERGYEPVSDEPCEEKLASQRQHREEYGIESSDNEHDKVTSSSTRVTDAINEEKQIKKETENESNESRTSSFKDALVHNFTKFHLIVPVYSIFFVAIFHTSLQAIIPLVAERMLNWSETDVSLLFTIWGVEITILAIILCLLSSKVSDRLLLLVSTIFGSLASVGVILLAFSPPMSIGAYYSLLVSIFVEGISITVLYVVGRSLVSKHTNPDNQGLVQAILTALSRLALLSGPLIGSSLFTNKKILAIILSGSQILGLALVILVFKKLKATKTSEV